MENIIKNKIQRETTHFYKVKILKCSTGQIKKGTRPASCPSLQVYRMVGANAHTHAYTIHIIFLLYTTGEM